MIRASLLLLSATLSVMLSRYFWMRVLSASLSKGSFAVVMSVFNLVSALAAIGQLGGSNIIPKFLLGGELRESKERSITQFIGAALCTSVFLSILLVAFSAPISVLLFDSTEHLALISAGAVAVPFSVLIAFRQVIRRAYFEEAKSALLIGLAGVLPLGLLLLFGIIGGITPLSGIASFSLGAITAAIIGETIPRAVGPAQDSWFANVRYFLSNPRLPSPAASLVVYSIISLGGWHFNAVASRGIALRFTTLDQVGSLAAVQTLGLVFNSTLVGSTSMVLVPRYLKNSIEQGGIILANTLSFLLPVSAILLSLSICCSSTFLRLALGQRYESDGSSWTIIAIVEYLKVYGFVSGMPLVLRGHERVAIMVDLSYQVLSLILGAVLCAVVGIKGILLSSGISLAMVYLLAGMFLRRQQLFPYSARLIAILALGLMMLSAGFLFRLGRA